MQKNHERVNESRTQENISRSTAIFQTAKTLIHSVNADLGLQNISVKSRELLAKLKWRTDEHAKSSYDETWTAEYLQIFTIYFNSWISRFLPLPFSLYRLSINIHCDLTQSYVLIYFAIELFQRLKFTHPSHGSHWWKKIFFSVAALNFSLFTQSTWIFTKISTHHRSAQPARRV